MQITLWEEESELAENTGKAAQGYKHNNDKNIKPRITVNTLNDNNNTTTDNNGNDNHRDNHNKIQ